MLFASLEIFTSLYCNSITTVIDLLFLYKCHDFKHPEHVSGFTINLYNYDLHHLCEYIFDGHLGDGNTAEFSLQLELEPIIYIVLIISI